MRLIHYSLTLILLMLSCLSAFAAPDLQVKEPRFDFGEVTQGDKVPHVFEFVNAGDENLVIEKVQSSCGCTAVLLSEKVIPPGGRGELKASFDSTRFRNNISKTIYLYSNDPVDPVLQLHIKGRVLETIAIEPAQVHFGSISAKNTVVSSVVLRNMGKNRLSLGEPRSTAAELVAKMSETSFDGGDEVTLELRLTPKPDQVRFSGYVLVTVEGLPKNELRIPVYAEIKD